MISKRGEGLKARVMTREKVRDYMCTFAHAPLQEPGDMLIRSTRDRIEKREGTRICAQNALLFTSAFDCAHVSFSLCVVVRLYCKQLITWFTDPSGQPPLSSDAV